MTNNIFGLQYIDTYYHINSIKYTINMFTKLFRYMKYETRYDQHNYF